jgi:TRAP-type C4-dicarboxylate transport system permease small subunit
MPYIASSLCLLFGLLALAGGITGKTMNRYGILRLSVPEDIARGLYIFLGFVGIILSILIPICEGHKN